MTTGIYIQVEATLFIQTYNSHPYSINGKTELVGVGLLRAKGTTPDRQGLQILIGPVNIF